MSFQVIGKSVTPLDAKAKAMGKAEYLNDIKIPGMLYGKVLRSPYAHARIKSIDTGEAEKIPEVKGIITFKDTPQIKFGSLVDDWYILAKDKVTFVGQEVAAVAALDEDTAEMALSLIRVEYEELPAVYEPEEALKEGAPVINEDFPDNVVFRLKVERGDIEEAFKKADAVFEDTYQTAQVYQAYLEPMGVIASWDADDKLTLYLSIQTVSKLRVDYARALGISPKNMRILKPYVGGGFGGKFEHVIHLICVELARKTKKPVKIVLDREEDFQAGNPLAPMTLHLKLAMKRDGTILGKKVKIIVGNGGKTVHGAFILSTACYRIDSLYQINNLQTEGYLVYTNTVPTGSYRGFGNANMTFAMESMLDRAARELALDPAAVRLRNVFPDGHISAHGWKINTSGLSSCVKKAVEISGWEKKRNHKRKYRGIGLACCNHVSGNRTFFRNFDGSAVLLRVGEEGQVTIIHGEADIGQGQNTVFAQMAAEAIGIKYEDIEIAAVDSQIGPFGLGAYSSRCTTLGGNAIIAAAAEIKDKTLEAAGAILGMSAGDLEIKEGQIIERTSGRKMLTFAEAARHFMYTHGGMPLTGYGYYIPNTVLPDKKYYGNVSPVYPFAAHIAEVEVDPETGHVDIVNYWAVHDIGRVINPVLAEGQIHGGVAQGIGWALTEKMITENGIIQNSSFMDYRIPGAKDLPLTINTAFIETNDPEGPFGAKGIGEPTLNPVPAAVLNAIFDATGIRFNKIPVTAEDILKALLFHNQKR